MGKLSDYVDLTPILPEVRNMLDRFQAPEALLRHIKAGQRQLLRDMLTHIGKSLPLEQQASFRTLEEQQWQMLLDSIEHEDPDGNTLSYLEINPNDLTMREACRFPKNAEGPTVSVRIRNVLDHNIGDMRLVNDEGTPLPEGQTFLD